DGLKKACADSPKRWPQFLPAILLASRTTMSRATGCTPYFMVYGVHPVFPFEMADATWQTLDWHRVTDTASLLALRAQQM
ncbi:hypothetical protein OF83DRAFT_1018094, partial [Amylostereum chailletii]